MTDRRAGLLATLENDRGVAVGSPSPFYAVLLDGMIEDVRAGGPTWGLLAPYAFEPVDEWYAFRALSGVHHEVLAGERPALAKHYPSVGGDGDAEAAWPGVRQAFSERDPEVLADLRHPLQTNETSRCGALIGGFCAVPDEYDRFSMLRAALDIARDLPVRVERASAEEWVERELASPPAGVATVVFHSIFWAYLPQPMQRRIATTIEAAGASATPEAPVAWLGYETAERAPRVVELRLRLWPGGSDRILGTGRHHWHPVRWL
jgi:hypothetical protein